METDAFRLMTYWRAKENTAPLTVYIEGDGYAWVNRTMPSTDPTPRTPVGLALALQDPSPNLAYLARPCQYVKDDPACTTNIFWTSHRFAPQVVESMNNAISLLLEKTGARGLHLVGYSGGGAVVALIAAQRTDILSLRTIAGNLDTEALNLFHEVSPTPESLNPIIIAPRLKGIPQEHWVGENDEVVPPFIAARFVDAMGHPASTRIVVAPNASHETGWSTLPLYGHPCGR